jgi:phospholipase/carboxylesterase
MSMDPHGNGAVLYAGAPLSGVALAVVLLHGRGGSAEDILGLASPFNLADVAYIAPQAAGHTWYPQSFLAPRQDNEPYLSSALAKVEAILRSIEQAGVQRNRIVIAGFSQGACLSTEFVASHPARYGGLIAFTGGLIGAPGTLHFGDEPDAKSALAGTPALFCSGDPDQHVPWKRVEESASILSAMGAVVTTRRYPGRPHTISAEELALGRSFLETARSQQQQLDRSE